jgi:hypothetical protein
VCFAALVGCSGERPAEPEAAALSPDVRADYAVFAVRCSKCHSLARPLNSGIDDDGYWRTYVAKMRRQPGSGISVEDSVAILRFLHAFSVDLRRRRSGAVDSADASLPEPHAQESSGMIP